MVTDTMCDEDILALAEVLRERDEGFIQITQATGDIKADLRVPREARRGRRAAHPAQRRRAGAHEPRDPPPAAALDRGVPRARACPIYAQCAHRARRASPSRSSTGTSTTPRPPGAPSPPARTTRSSSKMRDPELREALVAEAEVADRRLRAIQAGVGGNPEGPDRAVGERPRRPRAVRRASGRRRSPRSRASTRSR